MEFHDERRCGSRKRRCGLRKLNRYLAILDSIRESHKLPSCQDLGVSKDSRQRYVKKLVLDGIIEKVGYATWEVKRNVDTRKYIFHLKEGAVRSLGTRAEKPKTNLHALQITFPIIQGKIKEGNGWHYRERLKNWSPLYKELDVLGGLTIKCNNNKSITAYAHSRNIKNLNEVYNLSYKIKAYLGHYMRSEGIVLDTFNTKTSNLNVATEDKAAESMQEKSYKVELDLEKKSEKIFPNDALNAKAWIDGSPFKFSAETNDLEWKREYLSMPFRILSMFSLIETMTEKMSYVAENYKSHVQMVEKGAKVMDKLSKKLDQITLIRWY